MVANASTLVCLSVCLSVCLVCLSVWSVCLSVWSVTAAALCSFHIPFLSLHLLSLFSCVTHDSIWTLDIAPMFPFLHFESVDYTRLISYRPPGRINRQLVHTNSYPSFVISIVYVLLHS